MAEKLINIRNLNLEEIKAQIVAWKEPAFRAKQVNEWLWKHQAKSFDQMNNIGKSLQEKLTETYYIDSITARFIVEWWTCTSKCKKGH